MSRKQNTIVLNLKCPEAVMEFNAYKILKFIEKILKNILHSQKNDKLLEREVKL